MIPGIITFLEISSEKSPTDNKNKSAGGSYNYDSCSKKSFIRKQFIDLSEMVHLVSLSIILRTVTEIDIQATD